MNKKTFRYFNLLAVLILLANLLAACGEEPAAVEDTATNNEPAQSSPAEPTSTTEAQPTAEAATSTPTGPETWLVMMYQNADDEVLEEDIFYDLNEAEMVGSTDRVTIVSQMDRYNGAFEGDGDWTDTRRYLVKQDDDINTINSEELDNLGEVDSGNVQTLVDFATWAIQTYPATHYVLILSDHGAGWDGGWNDDDPVAGSSFKMQDIDNALGDIISQTGIGSFEVVGFDACLMGQLEVMSAIAPHARYAIGSEETEPSLGWAYSSFLKELTDNPDMTGKEFSKAIVDSYISKDIRITNDEARSIYADGEYTAKEVIADTIPDTTLSAIDLGAVQNLDAAVNDLALALVNEDQSVVAEARSYAQSYTNIFDDNLPPPYIDLGHFVDILKDSATSQDVIDAADKVRSALGDAVITEMHGDNLPGSNGLTIYFPNSDLYQTTFVDDPNLMYSSYVGRFATASLWDDYLTYHYTGGEFSADAADLSVLTPAASEQSDFASAVSESAPAEGAQVAGPGSGEITIAPLTISASEIGPDGKINIQTDITGSNIAYIYYYVSYYDEESNSYLTADMGYLAADETKEIDGVNYPDWGNEGVSVDFDWEPTLYFMSDGNEKNDQFAYFEPETYGTTDSNTTYTVRGTYYIGGEGDGMDAFIRFDGDGNMMSIFGFTDTNGAGAPREITPQIGDTFNITEEWLDFDQNPDGEFVDYEGGTMTYGKKGFEMVPYYAYSGKYILGILVEDMDGNTNYEYVEVTVTE